MAAKLVLALLALTAIVVATVFAAYRYFDNRHRRSHEKELKQMDPATRASPGTVIGPASRPCRRPRRVPS